MGLATRSFYSWLQLAGVTAQAGVAYQCRYSWLGSRTQGSSSAGLMLALSSGCSDVVAGARGRPDDTQAPLCCREVGTRSRCSVSEVGCGAGAGRIDSQGRALVAVSVGPLYTNKRLATP